MTTHLEHPVKRVPYIGVKHPVPVTLCERAVVSNPFVFAISIEHHVNPLQREVIRRGSCKRCLAKLAKGIVYLDPERGTTLVKHPA